MLIHTTPGRSLRWAPRWEPGGHSVLFDASSGDYWVLTEAARQLLEGLAADGPQPLASLRAHSALAGGAADELIAGLAAAGLLTAWRDGRAVALAQWADATD